MQYRAEIDGLRAVAVLSVILFHAGVEAFSGGFIGVDVFFVISGYLITGLVYEPVVRGRFSLVAFYERRARRILPALFLVCLACIPFAWRALLPHEFKEFSGSLVAVIAFASNFFFWLHSDYFAAPAETSLLHHTWSLAVEEQFYILYPLLLLGLRSAGRKAVCGAIVLVSLVSLGLAEYGSRIDPSGNFYLMPGRAWELAVGALVALNGERFQGWQIRSREWFAIAGLGTIVAALVLFDETVRHPGVMTLLPVLATATLIAFAAPDTVVGRLLASRPLVGIGLVSYSAYLWHQPLFALARIHASALSTTTYVVLIATTFVLAYLSWRFVEQPFRRKEIFRQSQIFGYAAVAALAVVTFGLIGHLTAGFPGRLGHEAHLVESWSRDRSPTYRVCTSAPGRSGAVEAACVHGASTDPTVAILGDSHAATISHRLSRALGDSGHALIEFSRTACPPVAGLVIHADRGKGCAEYNDQVTTRLSEGDIQIVVMFARWSQYIHREPFDNLEGGRTDWTAYATPVEAAGEPMSDDLRVARVSRLYAQSVEDLLRQGKRVVLVYGVPEVGWDVPREMMKRMRRSIGKREPVTTSYEVFKHRQAVTYAAFEGLGESPNLLRVRPEDVFCNGIAPGRCIAELGDKPLYYDDSHVNESAGAKMLVEHITRAMTARGWISPSQPASASRSADTFAATG